MSKIACLSLNSQGTNAQFSVSLTIGETIAGLIGGMRFYSENKGIFAGGIQTGRPIADALREKEHVLSPKHHSEFWRLYYQAFIQPWLH